MSNSQRAMARVNQPPANAVLVSDTELDKALHFLANNARDIGKAKARMVSAGHNLKHIEALEFKLADGSVEARKAEARTSERYQQAAAEDADAAGEYETLRALREAAALKIEVWRTACANYRSLKL